MSVDGYLNFNTRINTKGFQSGQKSIVNSVDAIKSAVVKLGTALGMTFGVNALANFSKDCISSARDAGSALLGLQSIIEGTGRNFSKAQNFLNKYVADGLVPMQNAVTAYKNLAARGYDDKQIQSVMLALKDSATYGKQANLTLGDAVQTATEGIKNENSILVDNAGVTKNVSIMWKEYAQSIGKSYTELTRQEKIQAEVNGIIEETKFQMGDAEKASNTFMGQTAKLSASFTNLKVAIGNTIIPALQQIIPVINSVVQKLTEFFTKMALYSELFFGVKKASDTATAGTDKAVSSTNALADAQENVADATADANKELKNSLTSMDELNILESETTDKEASGSDSDLNFGGLAGAEVEVKDKIDPKIALKIEQLRGKIEQLINTAKQKFNELWETLKPFRNFVSRGIEDFYNSFLKPLGKWTIGKGLPQLEKIFKNLVENTSWSTLNRALKDFWRVLEPFAEKIGEGLLWFIENILTPLTSWTIGSFVPAFLDTLSSAIESVNGTLESLKPLAQVLFNNFLKPLAEFSGNAIISFLNGIANHMDAILGVLTALAPLVLANVFGKLVISLGKLKSVKTIIFVFIKALGALKTAFSIIAVSGGNVAAMLAGLKAAFSSFCASFAAAFSPFQKVLIVVGSLVAIFVTAQKTFKKLSDGTTTVRNAVSNLILVLAPLGVALYAIMGPIGIVVEGVSLLAGAISGAVKSAKESLEQNFSSSVFNGIGKPITEYSDAISALASNIKANQKSIVELGDTIDNTNTQIEKSIDDLALYIGTFNATGDMTEENARQISNATSNIAEDIKTNMKNRTQLVIEALGQSFKDAALQSTEGTNEIINNMYLLNSQGDRVLADLQKEIDDTAYSLSGMDKNSTEYQQQFQKLNELSAKMAEYTSSTSESAKELQNFKTKVDNLNSQSIDLIDADTAKKSIESITKDYQEAFQSLEDAENSAIQNTKELYNQYEAMGLITSDKATEQINTTLKGIKENYTKQKSDLQNEVQMIADDLKSVVDKKTKEAISSAEKDFYDGSLKNALIYTFEAVISKGSDKSTEQVIKDKLTESLSTGMGDAMKELQSTIHSNGMMIGAGLSDGLQNGINKNTENVTSSADSMMTSVINQTKNTAGVHSPSTVFEEIGLNLMLGLQNGITGSSIFVSSALKSVADELIIDAENWFSPLSNVFQIIFINIADAFNQTIITAINSINSMIAEFNDFSFEIPPVSAGQKVMLDIPQIPIPKLATGTVVPANYGEFVAMLGDNKKETEVVSPLSTIKQALYEALNEALNEAGGVGGGDITIPIYIGNSLLDKYVITAQQRRNAITNGWR